MNKINRFILCIIDDVRADHFSILLKKGLMPHCEKLAKNGIYSNNCITDFPSITYPAHATILTGTYTGDYKKELCHGIPLSNWMDRSTFPPTLRSYSSNDLQIYKINQDLGKNCATILEAVEDGNTASIAQFINRGTDYFFPENKIKLILYYLLLMHPIKLKNMIARTNSALVHKLLDTFKRPTRYFDNNEAPVGSLLWFMSSDVLMHNFGFDSLIYKLNLLQI
ncbi:MAG: hypothetical protein GF353_24545, partial [Candidatus Lokiarchaeota archaeon]|nr:hypothetical protein [Candidatus Lokiarchaeota archaeon]